MLFSEDRIARSDSGRSFAVSLVIHCAVFGILWWLPPFPNTGFNVETRRTQQLLAESRKNPSRIVWFRRNEKLPTIAPSSTTSAAGRQPVKSSHLYIHVKPPGAQHKDQFIYVREPKIPEQKALPSPNVVMTDLVAPPAPPRPKQESTRLEAPQGDAKPDLQRTQQSSLPDSLKTAEKPARKKFVAPENRRFAGQVTLAEPAGLPMAAASLNSPKLTIDYGLLHAGKPQARKLVLPSSLASGSGGGRKAAGAVALEDPDVPSAGGQPGIPSDISAVIISANPPPDGRLVRPEGNRQAQIESGTNGGSGKGSGNGGGPGDLVVPGLTVRGGGGTNGGGVSLVALSGNPKISAIEITPKLVSGASNSSSKTLAAGKTICPCSIWGTGDEPEELNSATTAAIEVGMKFRSRSAGHITGMKFFKAPENVGEHVGHLWSKGGTLLGSVRFENETDSGWQWASFPNPIAIDADTTYVVSYQAPYGHYSRTMRGFSGSTAESGPLVALADSADGANGVYQYGSGFPADSHEGSNYWVDVVFEASPATTLLSSASKGTELLRSTLAVPVVESAPTSRTLSCTPRLIHPGDEFMCELRQSNRLATGDWSLEIDASSSDVRLPVRVRARANQSVVTFRGAVNEAASQANITISARDGADQVQEQLTVVPLDPPVLSVPGSQLVRPGEPLRFIVSTRSGADLPVQLKASELPAGATFQPETGQFEWTPAPGQEGESFPTFTATNSAGYSSTGRTRIVVDSGKPVITGASQFACTPESVATLNGRWLSQRREESIDPSGTSTNLGGTSVRINGTAVPVLFASQAHVDFLCPASAGSFNMTLETAAGSTLPQSGKILAANPTLLSVTGSPDGQGLITSLANGRLTTLRDFRDLGEPAQRDDVVSIRVTGLGRNITQPDVFTVKVGGASAEIMQIIPAPDAAGIYLIQTRIPVAAPLGDAVPVQVEMLANTGQKLTSNTVTMAIE